MTQEEAREIIMKIRGILLGHPPGDLVKKVDQIREFVEPQKKRREKGGYDREEKGGTDRSE